MFSALETIHSDDTSEENADPYSTFSANMEFKPAKNTERAEGKKAAAKPDFDTDGFKSEGLTTLKDEYQTITFTGFMSKQEAAAEKKAVSLVGIGSMVICVLMICMAAMFLSLLQNETNCFYTAGTFILGLLRQMMDQINTLRGE